MSQFSRRKLFALGGAGLAVAGGAKGAELHPGTPGITIQVSLQREGWMVAVPDWDSVSENSSVYQAYIAPIKWMPVQEFFSTLEAEDF